MCVLGVHPERVFCVFMHQHLYVMSSYHVNLLSTDISSETWLPIQSNELYHVIELFIEVFVQIFLVFYLVTNRWQPYAHL